VDRHSPAQVERVQARRRIDNEGHRTELKQRPIAPYTNGSEF
jgi:hypothetical protein